MWMEIHKRNDFVKKQVAVLYVIFVRLREQRSHKGAAAIITKAVLRPYVQRCENFL